MYGKFFASTFTGSMLGAGVHVFAVWGYVIANEKFGEVELNPALLAALLGSDAATMRTAIEYLCLPDPASRSSVEDGRRLMQLGPYRFQVVNHTIYQQLKNEEDRREYERTRKQEYRAKVKKSAQNGHTPPTVPPIKQTAARNRTNGHNKTSSAGAVMRACAFVDPKLKVVIEKAINAEILREPGKPEDIAKSMIDSWTAYTQAGEFLRFTWGPEKFFSQGHWLNQQGWPLDQEALQRRREANVGR